MIAQGIMDTAQVIGTQAIVIYAIREGSRLLFQVLENQREQRRLELESAERRELSALRQGILGPNSPLDASPAEGVGTLAPDRYGG